MEATARVIQELRAIEEKIPGALQRIYDAASNGEIDGTDYNRCALGHAVKDTEYDPSDFGDSISQQLYGHHAGLQVELLIVFVKPGILPEDNSNLETLQELILEVQNG